MNRSSIATASSAALSSACRQHLIDSVQQLWRDEWGLPAAGQADPDNVLDGVGVIMSGGVDTCAVMASLTELDLKPSVALTVFSSPDATDRPYAAALAAQCKWPIEHIVMEAGPNELLGEPLALCIRVLGTFDGMELRNSCVVARALLEAKKRGLNFVLTGDGSDELLGGYSFTHGSQDPEWSEKRNSMCANWFFSAPVLGEALGIKVASPFMRNPFKAWALTTTRTDCIGERMLEVAPGQERILKVTGKVPLREAFPNATSAWRRKDPIEVGSGSTVLGQDKGAFFRILGFEEQQAQVLKEHAIVIRDPEHLFYFNLFKDVYPNALAFTDGAPPPRERSNVLPSRVRDHPDSCVGCHFMLPTPKSNFCKVCGAWPARRK